MTSFWREQARDMEDRRAAINDGPATVIVGHRNGVRGWAIPGGGFTACKDRAREVAGEIHRIMAKPTEADDAVIR